MKKAYRINYNRWYTDEIFSEHLRYIKENIDFIDEAILIREFSHTAYWSLEDEAVATDLLKKRIKQYKAAGVKSVGVNIMSTIGHLNEAWGVTPELGLTPFTSIDGEVSKGCLCYSNDKFRDYTVRRYKMYASTEPDFIYLDDDIRPVNHTFHDGCFCDDCITRFNKRYGYDYDREGLKAHYGELEKRWYEFECESLRELIKLLVDTIKEVNPKIKIGYMSTEENTDISFVKQAGAKKLRPGGGFYSDALLVPNTVFVKAFETGRQIEKLGADMEDIQYEYENFPYLTYGKSKTLTVLEVTAALMNGCNGVAFNYLHRDDNPIIMEAIRENNAFWDEITAPEYKNSGIYCPNSTSAMYMGEIGIPMTSCMDTASAFVILGKHWDDFDDEQIKKMLSSSVFTDGAGIKQLTKRGFGAYCGGRVAAEYDSGMAQRFTAHPLNGRFKGYYRDVFMNFYGENTCCGFELDAGAESLATLETVSHKNLGQCSMYIYKNSLGGTVAADGYLNESFMRAEEKREQISNVLDLLSGGKMCVRISGRAKIIPIVRQSRGGNIKIMLTNAWFDCSGELECRIMTDKPLFAVNSDGSKTPVKQKITNGISTVTIDNLEPWRCTVITD